MIWFKFGCTNQILAMFNGQISTINLASLLFWRSSNIIPGFNGISWLVACWRLVVTHSLTNSGFHGLGQATNVSIRKYRTHAWDNITSSQISTYFSIWLMSVRAITDHNWVQIHHLWSCWPIFNNLSKSLSWTIYVEPAI